MLSVFFSDFITSLKEADADEHTFGSLVDLVSIPRRFVEQIHFEDFEGETASVSASSALAAYGHTLAV